MKRFVICLDGTWQQLRQEKPTNIGLIARSVGHKTTGPDGQPIEQVVFYSQGVGANIDALGKQSFIDSTAASFNRLAGGAFGAGLEDGIMDVYMRLAFNYERGDEIFIFGFSRGAFAARSLSGLINCAGIVSRMHVDKAWDAFALYREKLAPNATEQQKLEQLSAQKSFRMQYGKGARAADGTRIKTADVPPIKYLGIFDTVGQRGAPEMLGVVGRALNQRYGFHNLRICPNVEAARHAVAVDENRWGFPLTLWDKLDEDNARAGRIAYEQRWFCGTHGDVGGGNPSSLFAAPLKWVTEGAAAQGLNFYGKHGSDESPLQAALREAGESFDGQITRPSLWKSLTPMHYPFAGRRIWRNKKRPEVADAQATLDVSVAKRFGAARVNPRYQPAPIRPFNSALKEIARTTLAADELRRF